MIRSIFVPDEKCQWGSFDYSQQEPRVLVHFAALTGGGLKGADEVIESYKHEDPDFHQAVADMAGIDRRTAKTINLGMMQIFWRKLVGSRVCGAEVKLVGVETPVFTFI